MAHIILHDGKRQQVSHNQAVKVLAILNGEAQPENEEQAEYVAGVKEVQLPQLPALARKQRTGTQADDGKVERIKQINAMYLVDPRKRFQMIGEVLKGE